MCVCLCVCPGYLCEGLPVRDLKKLRDHYVMNRGFALDVLSILPLDIFYIATGPNAVALRLPRLFKFHRQVSLSVCLVVRPSSCLSV